MKVILKVKEGEKDDIGKIFEFTTDEPDIITFGRAEKHKTEEDQQKPHVQIAPSDSRLSRWHFMIKICPPNCFITDLDSSNGTYLINSSNPINRMIKLEGNEEIKAGRTIFQLSILSEDDKKANKYICNKCNREFDESEINKDKEIQEDNFVCKQCQEINKVEQVPILKEENKKKGFFDIPGKKYQKEPKIGEQVSICCFNCKADVTEKANKDQKAHLYGDDALYYCEKCANSLRKEQREIKEYIILSKIAPGGMGMVYKGWHKPTGRLCAIKEILSDVSMDEKCLKIFLREISINKDALHPNIARFYDTFSIKKKPYLVKD